MLRTSPYEYSEIAPVIHQLEDKHPDDAQRQTEMNKYFLQLHGVVHEGCIALINAAKCVRSVTFPFVMTSDNGSTTWSLLHTFAMKLLTYFCQSACMLPHSGRPSLTYGLALAQTSGFRCFEHTFLDVLGNLTSTFTDLFDQILGIYADTGDVLQPLHSSQTAKNAFTRLFSRKSRSQAYSDTQSEYSTATSSAQTRRANRSLRTLTAVAKTVVAVVDNLQLPVATRTHSSAFECEIALVSDTRKLIHACFTTNCKRLYKSTHAFASVMEDVGFLTPAGAQTQARISAVEQLVLMVACTHRKLHDLSADCLMTPSSHEDAVRSDVQLWCNIGLCRLFICEHAAPNNADIASSKATLKTNNVTHLASTKDHDPSVRGSDIELVLDENAMANTREDLHKLTQTHTSPSADLNQLAHSQVTTTKLGHTPQPQAMITRGQTRKRFSPEIEDALIALSVCCQPMIMAEECVTSCVLQTFVHITQIYAEEGKSSKHHHDHHSRAKNTLRIMREVLHSYIHDDKDVERNHTAYNTGGDANIVPSSNLKHTSSSMLCYYFAVQTLEMFRIHSYRTPFNPCVALLLEYVRSFSPAASHSGNKSSGPGSKQHVTNSLMSVIVDLVDGIFNDWLRVCLQLCVSGPDLDSLNKHIEQNFTCLLTRSLDDSNDVCRRLALSWCVRVLDRVCWLRSSSVCVCTALDLVSRCFRSGKSADIPSKVMVTLNVALGQWVALPELIPVSTHTMYAFVEFLYTWLCARLCSQCLLVRVCLQSYVARSKRLQAGEYGRDEHMAHMPVGASIAYELLQTNVPTYHLSATANYRSKQTAITSSQRQIQTSTPADARTQAPQSSPRGRALSQQGSPRGQIDGKPLKREDWHDERALAAAKLHTIMCSETEAAQEPQTAQPAAKASMSFRARAAPHTQQSTMKMLFSDVAQTKATARTRSRSQSQAETYVQAHKQAHTHTYLAMSGCGLSELQSIVDDNAATQAQQYRFVRSLFIQANNTITEGSEDENAELDADDSVLSGYIRVAQRTWTEYQVMLHLGKHALDDVNKLCELMWKGVMVVCEGLVVLSEPQANDLQADANVLQCLCVQIVTGMQSLMSLVTVTNLTSVYHINDMSRITDTYVATMLHLLGNHCHHYRRRTCGDKAAIIDKHWIVSTVSNTIEMFLVNNMSLIIEQQQQLHMHTYVQQSAAPLTSSTGIMSSASGIPLLMTCSSSYTDALIALEYNKENFHVSAIRLLVCLCALMLSDASHAISLSSIFNPTLYTLFPTLEAYFKCMQTHAHTRAPPVHIPTNAKVPARAKDTHTQTLATNIQRNKLTRVIHTYLDQNLWLFMFHFLHTALLMLNTQLRCLQVDACMLHTRCLLREQIYLLCISLFEQIHARELVGSCLFDLSIILCVLKELENDCLCFVHEYGKSAVGGYVLVGVGAGARKCVNLCSLQLANLLKCLLAHLVLTACVYTQTRILGSGENNTNNSANNPAASLSQTLIAYPTQPWDTLYAYLQSIVSRQTQSKSFAQSLELLSCISPSLATRCLETFRHVNITVTDTEMISSDDTADKGADDARGKEIHLSKQLLYYLCMSARNDLRTFNLHTTNTQPLAILNEYVQQCVCNGYDMCVCCPRRPTSSSSDDSEGATGACVCEQLRVGADVVVPADMVCYWVKAHFLHQQADDLLGAVSLINRYQYPLHTHLQAHGQRPKRPRQQTLERYTGSINTHQWAHDLDFPPLYLILFAARTVRTIMDNEQVVLCRNLLSTAELKQGRSSISDSVPALFANSQLPTLCRYVNVCVQSLRRDHTHILAHALCAAAGISTAFAQKLFWSLKVEVINNVHQATIKSEYDVGNNVQSTGAISTAMLPEAPHATIMASDTDVGSGAVSKASSNSKAGGKSKKSKREKGRNRGAKEPYPVATSNDHASRDSYWGQHAELAGPDPLPALAKMCLRAQFQYLDTQQEYIVTHTYTNMMNIVNISALLKECVTECATSKELRKKRIIINMKKLKHKERSKMLLKQIIQFALETIVTDGVTPTVATCISFLERMNAQAQAAVPIVPNANVVSPLDRQTSYSNKYIPSYLPTNTHRRIVSIRGTSGTPMQSAAKCPFMLTFDTVDTDAYLSIQETNTHAVDTCVDPLTNPQPNAQDVCVIGEGEDACLFKVHDDCRQDALTIEVRKLPDGVTMRSFCLLFRWYSS
jgi:hypothetical protein